MDENVKKWIESLEQQDLVEIVKELAESPSTMEMLEEMYLRAH